MRFEGALLAYEIRRCTFGVGFFSHDNACLAFPLHSHPKVFTGAPFLAGVSKTGRKFSPASLAQRAAHEKQYLC